ncbi:hypothetical protein [Novosphingobium sp. P6W]|uniref:hypothetical protein n=1 Tax=Novosphingobium sp. P6W TaxID=1609758 RepID=UPI0013B35E5E|nr:hypothetical protein [Novosphingobium sp. P6W]
MGLLAQAGRFTDKWESGLPRKLKVIVATKGHAFCRDAFEGQLRAIGVEPAMVDQLAAAMAKSA